MASRHYIVKAFVKVLHEGLTFTFEENGLSDFHLPITNYLQKQKQRVTWNDSCSETLSILVFPKDHYSVLSFFQFTLIILREGLNVTQSSLFIYFSLFIAWCT